MVNTSIISRVQFRLDDPTGRNYTSVVVVDELTLASKEISSHRTFDKYLFRNTGTFTLTSGTDTYDLPTQFTDYGGVVHQVVWKVGSDPASDTSVKLQYIPPEQIYDYQYQTGGSVGYYSLIGKKMVFAGVPDADDSSVSVKVWYTCNDGTYAADGNETTLGKEFPHLLINKCVYELAVSEQDGEISASADRAYKSYQTGFDLAIQKLAQGGSSEPRGIQVTDSGLL